MQCWLVTQNRTTAMLYLIKSKSAVCHPFGRSAAPRLNFSRPASPQPTTHWQLIPITLRLDLQLNFAIQGHKKQNEYLTQPIAQEKSQPVCYSNPHWIYPKVFVVQAKCSPRPDWSLPVSHTQAPKHPLCLLWRDRLLHR